MEEKLVQSASKKWINCIWKHSEDCIWSRKCYKIVSLDLSKQQALDDDPKALQKLTLLKI